MSWENNLRNRFEGAEFQPSDDVWLRIQAQVAAPSGRTRWLGRTPARYAVVAAVALLLAAGGWLLWPTQSANPAGSVALVAPPAPAGGRMAPVAPQPPAMLSGGGLAGPPMQEEQPLPVPQAALLAVQHPVVPPVEQPQVLAQLPPKPAVRLGPTGYRLVPIPERKASPFPEAQWAALDAPLPRELKRERPARWRVHLSGTSYQMAPLALATQEYAPQESMVSATDTIVRHTMPRAGIAWQTAVSYQMTPHWAVEVGAQAMYSVVSPPLNVQYVQVHAGPSAAYSTASAGLFTESTEAQQDGLGAASRSNEIEVAERHSALRLPVLMTLAQGWGRHQVALSGGVAGLMNFSRVIPMRRIDVEGVARMRYEYAFLPGLSVHTAVQVASPMPRRAEVLSPLHIGVQTGFSFRLPS